MGCEITHCSTRISQHEEITMARLTRTLPILALAGGVALAVTGCTQPTSPNAAYNASVSPQTGSAQGMNPHNSEPMPGGMQMRDNGLGSSTRLSTDRGGLPNTGSAQGVDPHNSEPMPRGMVMTPSRTVPMGYNSDGVPQTGSAQGVNSHNSEPMPRGMVMPPARPAP